MSAPLSSFEITSLLRDWQAGDQRAQEQLWPLVYGRLKRLAHQILRERRAGRSMHTTTLVHELYLRLLGGAELSWRDRGHFFAIAARAMRFVVVDQIRHERAAKRGSTFRSVHLDEVLEVPAELREDLVALDGALRDFESIDPRKCRIVELSYFAGLTYAEIGMALEISTATVKRELQAARLWLLRELSRG